MSLDLFSHRQGLKKVNEIFQVNMVSSELRNCIWNQISSFYLNYDKYSERRAGGYYFLSANLISILQYYWDKYFKMPIDEMPTRWDVAYKIFKKYILSASDFAEFYDFIEYLSRYDLRNGLLVRVNEQFINCCNAVFLDESSAYRFVNNKIVQITDPIEIEEIECAFDAFSPSSEHLSKALIFLSDKQKPDYKNSIKESISAVEAICSHISKSSTLSEALKEIQKNGKVSIHKALLEGFNKIYGYTSDEGGIRHALGLGDGDNVDFEDAKFMLIACSSFINYLKVKIDKAEISLSEELNLK